jgi:hypothetical protein
MPSDQRRDSPRDSAWLARDGIPPPHTCWLATINADGSPHVTGIGALWTDG